MATATIMIPDELLEDEGDEEASKENLLRGRLAK